MYNETHRPQFHFSARENWLNDPNGLFFYDGQYHLFFQHNPFGTAWGNMTWGHALSPNLLHWRQVEHALYPDALGTMFSGSAVVDWHNTTGFQAGDQPPIVLIYTAAGGTSPESQGKPFTQCLAFSTDGAQTWQKYPGNPVLGEQRSGNRDPKVTWHDPTRRWIITLYLDENDFALYASPDLIHWEHLHDLVAPDSIECPDLFRLPVDGASGMKKWVWMAGNGRYYIGDFDGSRFNPESDLLTGDWGANFYACQTYSDIPDPDARRIQIAWMKDGQYPGMPFNQQMSFPCEIRLRDTPHGPRLTRWPVREIERIWADRQSWENLHLDSRGILLTADAGQQLDISVSIGLKDARAVGLEIGGVAIRYDCEAQTLNCLGCTAPLAPEDGRIHLRCLLDRTSLEVFGNRGLVSMSSCWLPSGENTGLRIFAEDGGSVFEQVTASNVLSTWPKE